MGTDRIVQYECRVCGRKIEVPRTGDVYEEPVYCCGLESAEVQMPAAPAIPVAQVAVKKPVKKKAKKKAAKKKAKKKVAKKAKKKASKKKVAKKKKKAAKKKRK